MQGNILIRINGDDKYLRPDITALMGIEDDLKEPLMKIAKRFNDVEFGIKDVITIIYYGLKSGSGEIPKIEIMKAIQSEGLSAFNEPVFNFISEALVGPKKSEDVPQSPPLTESTGCNILDTQSELLD